MNNLSSSVAMLIMVLRLLIFAEDRLNIETPGNIWGILPPCVLCGDGVIFVKNRKMGVETNM